VSGNEHFLSRWSRRKQEAKQPAHDEPRPATDPEVVEGKSVQAADKPVAAEPADEFDLESLPPVDTIEATTDIRSFIAKGVPTDLTKAALRRAWSSDPAIRDFVGLSENAWDFNAPETIAGFGGALPADEARRILAHMMPSASKAESREASNVSAGEPIPARESAPGSAQSSGNSTQEEKHALVKTGDESEPTVAVANEEQHTTIENTNKDVAVQDINNSADLPAISRKQTDEPLSRK
jgi:hypothetical protein